MASTTLIPTQDLKLDSEFPNTNYGTDLLITWGHDGGGPAIKPMIFVFDLSSIPAGSTINSALLRRDVEFGNGGGNRPFTIRRLLRLDTTEAGMTFNRRNASDFWETSGARGSLDVTEDNKVSDVMFDRDTEGYKDTNVTGMVSDGLPNRQVGFVYKLDVETGFHQEGIESKEDTDKPLLEITYTPPPPAVSFETQPVGSSLDRAIAAFEPLLKLRVTELETVVEFERVDRNFSRIFATNGTIEWFAGKRTKIPKGYHLCDGRRLIIKENPILYELWGTMHGMGDGSTTFNAPDIIDRVICGAKSDGEPGNLLDPSNRIQQSSGTGPFVLLMIPIVRAG